MVTLANNYKHCHIVIKHKYKISVHFALSGLARYIYFGVQLYNTQQLIWW